METGVKGPTGESSNSSMSELAKEGYKRGASRFSISSEEDGDHNLRGGARRSNGWTSPDDRVTIAHQEVDDEKADNASKQVKEKNFILAPNIVFESTRAKKSVIRHLFITGSVLLSHTNPHSRLTPLILRPIIVILARTLLAFCHFRHPSIKASPSQASCTSRV